jgi:hypothetical protein
MDNVEATKFYRNKKNQRLYMTLGFATHSEAPNEQMVIYQAQYGDYSVWVRPLSLFKEKFEEA